MNDVVPEYAQAAERHLGAEAGKGWMENLCKMTGGHLRMGRVAITSEWVGIQAGCLGVHGCLRARIRGLRRRGSGVSRRGLASRNTACGW
jgi:hypothetical protein